MPAMKVRQISIAPLKCRGRGPLLLCYGSSRSEGEPCAEVIFGEILNTAILD